MLDPLRDVLPVKVRRYIYGLYALAAVVVGALNVGGVDIGAADEIIAYLAIPIAGLAAANAPDSEPVPPEDDIHA